MLELVVSSQRWVRVSFDPGHEWTKAFRPAVARLLGVTSLLFVNQDELRAISDTYCPYVGERAEERLARNVLTRMRAGGSVVVVKHSGATAIFADNAAAFRADIQPVPSVEDDTGAGDYFAACVLAAQLSPLLASRFGVTIGMYVARDKLDHVGPPSDDAILRVANELQFDAVQSQHRQSEAGQVVERPETNNMLPLRIAVVGRDAEAVARLCTCLSQFRSVTVEEYDQLEAAATLVECQPAVDGVFIDVLSFDLHDSTAFITAIRDRHREVGFVLYVNQQDVSEALALPKSWSKVLEHYWRMPKDAGSQAFAVALEDNLIMLLLYKLSEGRFGEVPGKTAEMLMHDEAVESIRHILRG